MSPVTTAAPACRPLREVVGRGEAEALAAFFRALGDPARLRLMSLIAAAPGAEACVCELVEPLGLSQPTVSHHLKVLTDAGVLEREQRGVWAYYRIAEPALAAAREALMPGVRGAGPGRTRS